MTPDFRRLWIGQAVSQLGSEVTFVALPLAAITAFDAGALEVGALSASRTASYLLLALAAGSWVDAHRRRPLLVGANLGRALALTAVPLLGVLGMLALWQLYALAVVLGCLGVVFDVAYLSYLPTLVSRDRLVAANSRLQATYSAAQIGGRGLGGLLVGVASAYGALLVDAVSYVVSLTTLMTIRTREVAPLPTGPHPPLGLGFRAALGHPLIRPFTLWGAAFNCGEELVLTVFLVHAARGLQMPPGIIGLVLAAGGCGAVVGAGIAQHLATRGRLGRMILVASILASCGPLLLLFAQRPGLTATAASAGAFAVTGFGQAMANVYGIAIRQVVSDSARAGRVHAAHRLVTFAAIPLGALMGGVAAGVWGVRTTLTIGVVAVSSTCVVVVGSRLRLLDGLQALSPDRSGAPG